MSSFVDSNAAKPITYGSDTILNNQMQKSVNMIITLGLGSLNPTAYKARSIAGRLLFYYSVDCELSTFLLPRC